MLPILIQIKKNKSMIKVKKYSLFVRHEAIWCAAVGCPPVVHGAGRLPVTDGLQWGILH